MLSHGQTGVERDFSINKEILEYSVKERSMISLGVIYDRIQAVGGIFNVDITQPLRSVVRRASIEYQSEVRKQEEAKKKNRGDK